MKPHTATGLDWLALSAAVASGRKSACQALPECLAKGWVLVTMLDEAPQLSFHLASVGRTLGTTPTEGQLPLSSSYLCAGCDMIHRGREVRRWLQVQPRMLLSLTQTY